MAGGGPGGKPEFPILVRFLREEEETQIRIQIHLQIFNRRILLSKSIDQSCIEIFTADNSLSPPIFLSSIYLKFSLSVFKNLFCFMANMSMFL